MPMPSAAAARACLACMEGHLCHAIDSGTNSDAVSCANRRWMGMPSAAAARAYPAYSMTHFIMPLTERMRAETVSCVSGQGEIYQICTLPCSHLHAYAGKGVSTLVKPRMM